MLSAAAKIIKLEDVQYAPCYGAMLTDGLTISWKKCVVKTVQLYT